MSDLISVSLGDYLLIVGSIGGWFSAQMYAHQRKLNKKIDIAISNDAKGRIELKKQALKLSKKVKLTDEKIDRICKKVCCD